MDRKFSDYGSLNSDFLLSDQNFFSQPASSSFSSQPEQTELGVFDPLLPFSSEFASPGFDSAFFASDPALSIASAPFAIDLTLASHDAAPLEVPLPAAPEPKAEDVSAPRWTVHLHHKPRGLKGQYKRIRLGEGLRCTKGKGKRLKLEFRCTWPVRASHSEVFLLERSTHPPQLFRHGHGGFSVFSVVDPVLDASAGVYGVDFDVKIDRMSKHLQFIIKAASPTNPSDVIEAHSFEFEAHNNGKSKATGDPDDFPDDDFDLKTSLAVPTSSNQASVASAGPSSDAHAPAADRPSRSSHLLGAPTSSASSSAPGFGDYSLNFAPPTRPLASSSSQLGRPAVVKRHSPPPHSLFPMDLTEAPDSSPGKAASRAASPA
eukprot:TRINITY_DN14321_c0_g1_i1.p1 TRINITY_DN14321_c0_g1~~TRINITY_DN14321_c0_g1_i1.p1  ORF type:complete len:375 (+),score=86.46 TRINITY_DN14321_c0_g1_i1:135-1259(+)